MKIRLEENKYADNPKYIAHIYTGGNKAIASQPVNDEAQAVKWAKAYSNSTPYSNGRQKAETYLNQKMKEAGVRVANGGGIAWQRGFRDGETNRPENITQWNSAVDEKEYKRGYKEGQQKRASLPPGMRRIR